MLVLGQNNVYFAIASHVSKPQGQLFILLNVSRHNELGITNLAVMQIIPLASYFSLVTHDLLE